MNRLIIVGNGFDLAHGLNTRYSDFMLHYLKEAISVNAHVYEDDLIRIEFTSRYLRSRHDLEGFKSVNDLIAMCTREGHHLIYKTFFVKAIIEKCSECNWVDIENLYNSHLLKVIPKYVLERQKKEATSDLRTLNKQLHYLKDKLINYLLKIEANFELDKESSIYHEVRKILSSGVKKKTIQDYGGVDSVRVLNFNYTNTVSRYIDDSMRNEISIQEVQIHGKLSMPNSIVFGFGDGLHSSYAEMENLNDNLFFEHVKSFKYLQNIDYQDLMEFVDDYDDFEVYVLGHSLGLSDRTMLSNIFESKYLRKVQLFYYKDQADYVSKTHEISRHFSDKNRMLLKVVPFSSSRPMPQYLPTIAEISNN